MKNRLLPGKHKVAILSVIFLEESKFCIDIELIEFCEDFSVDVKGIGTSSPKLCVDFDIEVYSFEECIGF